MTMSTLVWARLELNRPSLATTEMVRAVSPLGRSAMFRYAMERSACV